MLKVIVVDDNKKRVDMFLDEFHKKDYGDRVRITTSETADQARLQLKSQYDLMILDVVLPKKIGGTPQSLNSFNLLKELYQPSSKYIKPNMIIGLTADLNDISQYRTEFGERFVTVTEGATNSLDWINRTIETIEGLLGQERKIISCSTDKTLITVHGIRTYGKWQRTLRENLELYSREFDYIDIKYGFFDLISFSIPYLRMRRARKAAEHLFKSIEQNTEKNIYIVAHSYGTLITSLAFEKYAFSKKIKCTILCGSPLSHDTSIDHIVKNSEKTINECGTSDIVLILSRMFVLGMGDAGRVGFSRENSKTFINRYHKGGHSLYFRENQTPTFYDEYWTPMLSTDSEPAYVDNRTNFFGEDLLDLIIKFTGKIKIIFYILLVIGAISLFL